MKLSLVLSAAAFTVTALAQDIGPILALPPCPKNCIFSTLNKAPQYGCSSTDARCLCRSAGYQAELRRCATQCPPNEQELMRNVGRKYCADIGVPVNSEESEPESSSGLPVPSSTSASSSSTSTSPVTTRIPASSSTDKADLTVVVTVTVSACTSTETLTTGHPLPGSTCQTYAPTSSRNPASSPMPTKVSSPTPEQTHTISFSSPTPDNLFSTVAFGTGSSVEGSATTVQVVPSSKPNEIKTTGSMKPSQTTVSPTPTPNNAIVTRAHSFVLLAGIMAVLF